MVSDCPVNEKTLILRHDVDQHPRSALRMAAIEEQIGVRSTWYFRWRTAHPVVIERLRERGFTVGLHYETLTRLALESGSHGAATDERRMAEARATLRDEITAFADRFGAVRSICPHGDTRVPELRNATLLQGQDAERFGVEFDGNQRMHGTGLAEWLTDRSAPEGSWVNGLRPTDLFESGSSPILCLTHPNNWASGPDLWLDRILAAVLPSRSGRWRPSRPIRTGSDTPPLPAV